MGGNWFDKKLYGGSMVGTSKNMWCWWDRMSEFSFYKSIIYDAIMFD